MQYLIPSKDGKNLQYDLLATKDFLQRNFQVPLISSRVPYHCYWFGKFTKRHFVSVMSCLRTQSLPNIYLWLDVENGYHENLRTSWINRLRDAGVIIKSYRPDEMAENTPLQDQPILKTLNLPLRADCCRYLLLHKIGGVYFDLDVIFIRDMQPILHLNFVYELSHFKDGNNAIMRMTKQSNDTLRVLNTVKNLGLKMHNCREVFASQYYFEHLFCLPSTFFDPVWLSADHKAQLSPLHVISTFDEFFSSKRNPNKPFFPFCFAYDYNGRWKQKIKKGSWFDYFVNLTF